MASSDLLENTLRSNKQSVTRTRQAVFAALQGREPQSMAELSARVADTDRASIYRTIALFERLGIVQRLQTGWKYKLELSDTFHEHHHHATCLRCGRSITLPEDSALETQLQALATKHGFLLERHQLELQGMCASCQKQSSPARKT